MIDESIIRCKDILYGFTALPKYIVVMDTPEDVNQTTVKEFLINILFACRYLIGFLVWIYLSSII
jgi:hypothetical protein